MQALEVNVQFEITMQIRRELPFFMISLYGYYYILEYPALL